MFTFTSTDAEKAAHDVIISLIREGVNNHGVQIDPVYDFGCGNRVLLHRIKETFLLERAYGCDIADGPNHDALIAMNRLHPGGGLAIFDVRIPIRYSRVERCKFVQDAFEKFGHVVVYEYGHGIGQPADHDSLRLYAAQLDVDVVRFKINTATGVQAALIAR